MGTRAFLGYEKSPRRIYFQYTQFDGYPTCKGKEFYEGVIGSVADNPSYYVSEAGRENSRPNPNFFKRIQHFLDEYQYSSPHSVGNHQTIDKHDWTKIDQWQEWQYLFTRDGDFVILKTGNPDRFVIPWSLTSIFLSIGRYSILPQLPIGRVPAQLDPFWKKVEMFLTEEQAHAPVLSAEYGETLAFPSQEEKGWREYAVAMLDGKVIAEGHHSKGKKTTVKRTSQTGVIKG